MTPRAAIYDDPLLTTDEVAARYGYHPQHLRNLRSQGKGPKAITLPGGKRVRYRASDLLAWELSLEPTEVAA